VDEENTGSYNWTVGLNDNVDDSTISSSQNFVFVIEDPSGTASGDGYVDGALSSRAFIIKSNDTTTTTSSTSSTTTSPSTTTAAFQASATQTESSTTSEGLSTGAKAGIGIGAAIGGLLLLSLGFFLFRKLKSKPSPQDLAADLTPDEFPPTYGSDAAVGGEKSLQHLQQPLLLSDDSRHVGELPAGLWSGGTAPAQELATPVHELDGRTA
jgi:hypothetical protein